MKLRNGKLSNRIQLLRQAKQEITEHNAPSLLIQLPAEIRNEIFGYVISDHLVHIYGSKQCNDNTLCSATTSEKQAQQNFYAMDPDLFEQPDKNPRLVW